MMNVLAQQCKFHLHSQIFSPNKIVIEKVER